MRILYLGPETSLVEFLRADGNEVVVSQDAITVESVDGIDFLVSFGYRHIIKRDVLESLQGKAINLHVSYLPWNRGADPNLWANIEGTPNGVTIHYIDEGIDTGDIIAQRMMTFDRDDTLATSYNKLKLAIKELLRENWLAIKTGACGRKPQRGVGTYHKVADRKRVENMLRDGWDTKLDSINGTARKQMLAALWRIEHRITITPEIKSDIDTLRSIIEKAA